MLAVRPHALLRHRAAGGRFVTRCSSPRRFRCVMVPHFFKRIEVEDVRFTTTV
ncbi:hypothetical protein E2C01_079454 [Portunus trituberculatus]|uniref:Uncharacterized protein n=1 Tax=Portunus trituberculatus TaxID=210409 RepID=A0A5B7IVN8_PORTR|nr:hypothetical protein [Portunus trituberculatus]